MTSWFICKKTINKLLCDLNLPKDDISMDCSEEDLFLRLFDIQTFGHSANPIVSKMWVSSERLKKLDHTKLLKE